MADYPSTVFAPPTIANGDTIDALDPTRVYDEMVAVQSALLGTLEHDVVVGDGHTLSAALANVRETWAAASIVAGVLALDLATASHFSVSLNAAITSITFANAPATGVASAVVLKFTADGTVRAITWPASVKWAGGVAPTMTGTSGHVDFVSLYTVDGGTTRYGFPVQDFS